MSAPVRQLVSAERLLRQGQTALAIEACLRALGSGEDDVGAHALLAQSLLEADYFEGAIRSAETAIELDPSCAAAYLTLGLALDRLGGAWDRSVLVWQELAEVAPTLSAAHVCLGEALSAAAFEDEAIDAWHRALEIDPRDARAMYDLALAALRKHGMATALPGFRKAGALDRSQDDYFFALCGPLAASDEPARAGADGSERDSRLRTAYSLAREGELIAAALEVRDVLALDASDADALALAGYLYLAQESGNEAMAVSLRSLVVSAKTPAAVYVLGQAFARVRGLQANAARVLGALAVAVPHHPMSHVLLAESLLGLVRLSDARAAYDRAIELDPGLVRARFGRAAVYAAQGEHEAATYEARRAAFHDTRRSDVFSRLYREYSWAEGARQ